MKYFILTFVYLSINSCSSFEMPGFKFDNFKDTEAYNLAIAVKNNDLLLQSSPTRIQTPKIFSGFKRGFLLK